MAEQQFLFDSMFIKINLKFIIFTFSQPVPVAQWIARWTSNPKVAGSNPAGDKYILFFNFKNPYLTVLKKDQLYHSK